MPKVIYRPDVGLFQEEGESIVVEGDTSSNSVASLDVTRNVTLRTSTETGISEVSGSLLILRGKDEPLFFHLGGDQYLSSNAWFDADEGAWGAWKFAEGSGAASAFRWGFRSVGRFELDVDDGGSAEGTVSWTTAMAITSSNGFVGINKTSADADAIGSFNGVLDVSGSWNMPALAVTGSVDLGGGAADAYFMPPKHTNTTRDALTAKAGMMIYNTTTNKLNFYNGSAWKAVDDSAV
tara:strand:+ start:142 stop:852 length:711 start_codon:yes stop_codon:yes gene_type:complete